MEQSGPSSNLPGILSKATDVFGSPELAEE